MKLIGSKIENEYREQLVCSHKSLFEDEEKKKILSALRTQYPKMKTAYTLDWIPEQGEDIYRVLVDMSLVATVEVDRLNAGSMPIIEDVPIEKFQKNLSKTERIKLAVAVDLAQSDIG